MTPRCSQLGGVANEFVNARPREMEILRAFPRCGLPFEQDFSSLRGGSGLNHLRDARLIYASWKIDGCQSR
jgi:hypothetical protein